MKKFFLSLLILSLAVLLCNTLLTACEKDIPDGPSDTSAQPDNGSTTVAPDGDFDLYRDGEYRCTLVVPDDLSSDEYKVAKELMIFLFEQTRISFSYVKESEFTGDGNVIILGETSFDESKSAYAALGKREGIVKTLGNKLIIAFENLTGGLAVMNDLISTLRIGASDDAITLPSSYSNAYTALPNADELPEYSYAATTSRSCGENTKMLHAASTPDEFESYCRAIEAVGFKKTVSREQSGNIFYTFEGEDDYIYAYFSAYNNEIRVLTGPLETLAAEDYSSGLPETFTPYIASIPQPNNGQGYIIRLPDGRFLIHDGGYSGDDRVYATLRQLVPTGDIVIAAWFISHPHPDHYAAFVDFARDHGNDKAITVERIIFNYGANNAYVVNTSERQENNSSDAKNLRDAIADYLPDVPVIKIHTGQTMRFGSVEIEVLYTVEDILPRSLPNVNDSSLVIRIHTETSSIILLADTCYDSGPILNSLWGEYLKTDIMQVAHHGQWPSEEEIYHSIQGEVVLFPAVRSRLKEYLLIKEGAGTMRVVMNYAKDIYFSGDSMEIIELPYTVKNNKSQMLTDLNPDLTQE